MFDIEIAASFLSLVTYVLLWKFMRGLSMYVGNCIINQSGEFVMKNAKGSTDQLTTANRMKSDYHTAPRFLCESAMKLGRTVSPAIEIVSTLDTVLIPSVCNVNENEQNILRLSCVVFPTDSNQFCIFCESAI